VSDRIADSGWDASEVEVTVSSGEVTLSGVVNDRNAKYEFESIAEGISGVKDVHNQVRVKRESEQQSSKNQSSGSSLGQNSGLSNNKTEPKLGEKSESVRRI